MVLIRIDFQLYAGHLVSIKTAAPPTSPVNFDDDMQAFVLGDSSFRLWGLTPAERIRRQLLGEDIALWRSGLEGLPAKETVLVLRGDCLYDTRVIRGLVGARDAMLKVDIAGGWVPVAAHVTADQAASVGELVEGRSSGVPAAGIATMTVEQLAQRFEPGLLKADRPYVRPVTAENRTALEQLVFSGAYKGVTDLVTKWVWPRPAQWVTRGCVRMGITPNQVTAASLVLVILAGVLFARGEYALGLVAAWVMTFLDTVDGKLARVTVTSTRLGNVFDHGIDLIHPPLWYIAWGVGLAGDAATMAGGLTAIYLVILAGYVGGRLCEGAFQLFIAPFSIFTWRPFDSWFRLIVARRNPNMIMLTIGLVVGRPDLGLVAVATWTALSTAILFVRLLQALHAKRRRDTPRSWLAEIGETVDEAALAVRVFTHNSPVLHKG